METSFVLIDTIRIVMYILIGVAIIYLLYKLYQIGKSLGGGIIDGTVAVAKAVWGLATATPVTAEEMFTPHNEDGTVNPADIPPKGIDPIDWIIQRAAGNDGGYA